MDVGEVVESIPHDHPMDFLFVNHIKVLQHRSIRGMDHELQRYGVTSDRVLRIGRHDQLRSRLGTVMLIMLALMVFVMMFAIVRVVFFVLRRATKRR